jgi:hypothetical protein
MIDVREVIGRNPRTVERLLGKPDKIDIVKVNKPLAWRKASYCKGQIDIVYIDNVADWITLHNKQDRTADDFIQWFGLTDLTPPSSYNGLVKYRDVAGLKEIMCMSHYGKPTVIHIKAFTE